MSIKEVLAPLYTEIFSLFGKWAFKTQAFQASSSHSLAHNDSMSLFQRQVSRVVATLPMVTHPRYHECVRINASSFIIGGILFLIVHREQVLL